MVEDRLHSQDVARVQLFGDGQPKQGLDCRLGLVEIAHNDPDVIDLKLSPGQAHEAASGAGEPDSDRSTSPSSTWIRYRRKCIRESARQRPDGTWYSSPCHGQTMISPS